MDKKNQRRKTFVIIMHVLFSLFYTFFIALLLYLWGRTRILNSIIIFYIPLLFIAFAILGVAALSFRYYRDIHQVTDRKKEKKYLTILAIVLLLISVASITGIEIKHYDLTTYTREKWLEKGYDRGRMIKSFTKKVDLVGKSAEDVIYYLGVADREGEPYGNQEFAYSYFYQIGNYLDWIDPATYEVYFNESNIVTSAQIVQL